jgi:hypothetical protein
MDLGAIDAALIDGIGQFAGTFANPLTAMAVLVLACVTQRPAWLRLACIPIGAVVAAGHILDSPNTWDAAFHLLGSICGALLQVELLINVAFPVLAFGRRILRALFPTRPTEDTLPPA